MVDFERVVECDLAGKVVAVNYLAAFEQRLEDVVLPVECDQYLACQVLDRRVVAATEAVRLTAEKEIASLELADGLNRYCIGVSESIQGNVYRADFRFRDGPQ